MGLVCTTTTSACGGWAGVDMVGGGVSERGREREEEGRE